MIQNERGFTMVELLIGVMIVGVLTAFSAPQFSGLLRSYRLNSATRVVWGDMHRARMLAIKENRAIRVNFTPNTSYSIVRVAKGQVVFTRDLAAEYPEISVGINNNPFIFGSTGNAGFGSGTVTIQSPSGTKSFTILTTGRIGNLL